MAIPRLNVIIGADGRPLTKTINELRSDIEKFKQQLNDTRDPAMLANLNRNLKQAQTNIKVLEQHGIKAKKSFAELGAGLAAGLGIAVFQAASAAASNFFNGAINEALEARRAVENLRQSLESVGRGELLDSLSASASELARQFRYLDNDDITNVFTKLIQFGGLTEKQMRDLVPVIVDLNAKQRLAGEANKTVAETSEDIVKALSGQSRELKKYGVDISDGSTLTERLGMLMGVLAGKVRDAANAYGTSLEGRIEAVNQKMRDQQEIVANRLLPTKVALMEFAADVIDEFQSMWDWVSGGFSVDKIAGNWQGNTDWTKEARKYIQDIGEMDTAKMSKLLEFQQASLELAIKQKYQAQQAGQNTNDEENRVNMLSERVRLLKEEIRLQTDKRKLGTGSGNGTGTPVDALANQLKVLKTLAGDNKDGYFALEALKVQVQIDFRDAKAAGASAQELAVLEQIGKEKIADAEKKLAGKPLTYSPPIVTKIDVAGDAGRLSGLPSGNVSTSDTENDAKVREAFERRQAQIEGAAENFESAMSGIFGGLGDSLGESLSIALTPDANASDIAKPILLLLADVVQQIGKAILSAGITLEAAKKAIKALWANPPLAIAAGIGLVALGALLKAQINKKGNESVKKFAEGGVTTRPTYMTSEYGQPEAIIPLDRLPSLINRIVTGDGDNGGVLEARIAGDDLVFLYDKRKKAQNRLR